MSSLNKDNNEFEGKIKITNFASKDEILEKINSYCDKYKDEENNSVYDVEKENDNLILLNFHKNTEIANYIIRELKILQIDNPNFSELNYKLLIKIINPQNEKDKQAKKEKKEKENQEKNEENDENKEKLYKKKDIKKIKNYDNDIYNIDTKNNPKLNKLLGKSLNFNRRNINKFMSPENNKMKIYESIFLGGKYLNKNEIIYEENRKNKAKWLNKKGFIPYIGKETILKNTHMIDNILYKEPAQDNNFKFRSVQKYKWVGKHDFFA